jgi:large subunit ribosomal protein L25
MEVGKLTVQARDKFGKGASRKQRAEGLIPGICYGYNIESPLAVLLNPRELRASLDPIKKINTVIEVTVQGAKTATLNAMIKDSQIHPITQKLEHVDFIAIDTDKTVDVEVPILLTGKSVGVIEGGILNVVLRSIEVRCKPVDIPVEFKLDVTELDIGDNVHVGDMQFPPGVEPITSAKQTVVTCVAPREEEEVKPVELAEGEEGAEGAAPAEGAAEGGEAKAEGGEKKEEAKKD